MTIALTMAVLMSLCALALRTTMQSSAVEASSRTHALVTSELNRLIAAPYASLPGRAGCDTTYAAVPHTRCVTVTELSPQVRRLTLVVSTLRGRARADTVVIDRASAPAGPLQVR